MSQRRVNIDRWKGRKTGLPSCQMRRWILHYSDIIDFVEWNSFLSVFFPFQKL